MINNDPLWPPDFIKPEGKPRLFLINSGGFLRKNNLSETTLEHPYRIAGSKGTSTYFNHSAVGCPSSKNSAYLSGEYWGPSFWNPNETPDAQLTLTAGDSNSGAHMENAVDSVGERGLSPWSCRGPSANLIFILWIYYGFSWIIGPLAKMTAQ